MAREQISRRDLARGSESSIRARERALAAYQAEQEAWRAGDRERALRLSQATRDAMAALDAIEAVLADESV